MKQRPTATCPECGAALVATADGIRCERCLLQAGLEHQSELGDAADTVTFAGSASGGGPPGSRPPDRLGGSHAPSNGNVIGGYRDLQVIHDWSGGTVYKAYHAGLDRKVLLRVLDASAGAAAREAFLSRAETLSRLSHPHTVTTFEAGESGEVAYVAEEYIEGRPLGGFLPRTRRERWREGFFPSRDVVAAMRDAASGLQALHNVGIIHGRIEPDSVLIDRNATVRLVGLGQSAEINDERFAIPQSLKDRPIASEIYQLGATFCFLTTGKLPAELSSELSASKLARELKKQNPGLQVGLCQIIAQCVDPGNQDLRTADDVVQALNPLLTTRVSRAPWRHRIGSAVLEIFALTLILGLAQRRMDRFSSSISLDNTLVLFLLIFGVPIAYITVFESVFGWTFVRRLFGLRLLNQAGERCCWSGRLCRATLKWLTILALFFAPSLLLPLLPGNLVDPRSGIVLAVSFLFSPLIVLYGTARWIPSHWTFYDLLAGVTWGDETPSHSLMGVRSSTGTSHQERVPAVGSVDQYEIFEKLGSGGMGEVFRGRDRILGRHVAVKVLAEHLTQNPLLLERFQREARLAAKVSHPNVAQVYGNGVWNETPYIAMEFVPGQNLQEIIRERGAIPLPIAWDYVIQAAEALRAAHRGGVVHRDIKPANLMIAENGQLKVTDFGISRQVTTDTHTTELGTIVGTPAYMAPEQAMGKLVDVRSDIYSLGMTLYHMLSGRAPFRAANAVEMLAQQMTQSPSQLLGEVKELTETQHEVLEKMIAKDPRDRYRNYDELIADLKQCAPGVDRLATPLKRIAAETMLVTVFYLVFTMSILPLALTARRLGLTGTGGTAAIGGLFAVLLLVFAGVQIIMTARRGATPGKKLFGFRVVGMRTSRVGHLRAVLRFIAAYPILVVLGPITVYSLLNGGRPVAGFPLIYTLSVTVQLVVTVASLLMLWLHPRRRTVHDLVAGTYVVRDKS